MTATADGDPRGEAPGSPTAEHAELLLAAAAGGKHLSRPVDNSAPRDFDAAHNDDSMSDSRTGRSSGHDAESQMVMERRAREEPAERGGGGAAGLQPAAGSGDAPNASDAIRPSTTAAEQAVYRNAVYSGQVVGSEKYASTKIASGSDVICQVGCSGGNGAGGTGVALVGCGSPARRALCVHRESRPRLATRPCRASQAAPGRGGAAPERACPTISNQRPRSGRTLRTASPHRHACRARPQCARAGRGASAGRAFLQRRRLRRPRPELARLSSALPTYISACSESHPSPAVERTHAPIPVSARQPPENLKQARRPFEPVSGSRRCAGPRGR
eukprot:355979-Chlamydomonas_euryale.AAC.4